jgi:hypothetical protein
MHRMKAEEESAQGRPLQTTYRRESFKLHVVLLCVQVHSIN